MCNLSYIPKRLHKNGRLDNQVFYKGESLFIRINPNHPTPFESITLANLSLNRSGIDNEYSYPEDVLWNTREDKGFEKFHWTIKTMNIGSNSYNEVLQPVIVEKYGDDYCKIILKHLSIDCNFAHCDMDFIINGNIVVTKENFKETLGSKRFKKLRSYVRQRLHESIVQKLFICEPANI